MHSADDATTPREAAAPKPTFTIVSAVYNVARYLDDFITSIEEQTYPRHLIQVVAVDDGSTDESLERLQRWQRESKLDIVVVTKENGGQGSARNLGMTHATGDWVTFTDPDDTLGPRYFTMVARFLDAHPETDMVASRLMVHDEKSGRYTNSHPLRSHFRDGNVARRLDAHPDYFAGSAPSALFRRERLEALQLRFDDRVRPNFEDGHFCVRYLLACDDPVVGFVRTARYNYRRRSDGSSTLQNSMQDVRRFTDVPRHGYLDVIRRAVEKYGAVPRWLQSYLTYELSWYISSGVMRGDATAARGAVADEFHALVREIMSHIDPNVLATFNARPLDRQTPVILQHGYDETDWHQEPVGIIGIDDKQGLAQLSYYYTGERPDELIEVGGKPVAARYGTVRDVVLFDRIPVRQRIVWVPFDGTIHLTLNGEDVALDARSEPPAPTALASYTVARAWRGDQRVPSPEQLEILRRASTRRSLRRYRDAWVFMDRIHDADDSAEHLFHHVREHHPEVNAWFVVQEGTADWNRLKRAGVKRLVAHGSDEWRSLMVNAAQLISSHADIPTVRPYGLTFPEAMNWRFAFLQHGVIKDDLSGWLNSKPIDVFVTSTRAEYDSIAGEHNHYRYTPKEVVLTGLPRFDRLRAEGLAVPPEKRDLILLVPTWRSWLTTEFVEPNSQKRAAPGKEFFESEFITEWMGVLRSPELKAIADRHGLTVGFLPHPNLQAALPGLDLPEWVEPLTYEGNDVRKIFARAAVMVTDYSSVAFNAAYIDRPVVYFQFDTERFFGGGHVGQSGYFDYRRDGFGPVTDTVEQTLKEIGGTLDAGRAPQEPYASRVSAAFPVRDGQCCERVYQAIVDSVAPRTRSTADLA